MYVGRIEKETNDVREVTIDLSRWLDTGELVGRVSVLPVVPTTLNSQTLSTGTWQPVQDISAPAALPSPPPPDTTPLVIVGASVASNGQQVRMLLAVGTPGLAYTASLLVVSNLSPRQKELDVLVIVTASFNLIPSTGASPSMTQIVSGSAPLPLGFAGLAIVQNATGGPITVTLPPSPSPGQAVRAVDDLGNAGTYPVAFQSADGSPVVNASSFSFTDNFQSATFTWTGSRWSLG